MAGSPEKYLIYRGWSTKVKQGKNTSQENHNHSVGGSNPSIATIFYNDLEVSLLLAIKSCSIYVPFLVDPIPSLASSG